MAVQGRAELAVLLTVAELAVFTVDSCQWLYKVLLSWPCLQLTVAVQGRAELAVLLTVAELAVFTVDS